ncbi:MAG: hypothetical protein FWG33_03235, partial [Oscillospiraceae bacterium]|nr:hypothetical protein [Oscillospiraceae bacterium]
DIRDIIPVTAGKDPETGVDVKAGALMGIMVPSGSHTIELSFFPNYMPLGILLTFVGLGGFVLLWYVIPKTRIGRGKVLEQGGEDDDYNGFDDDYVNLDSESEYDDFDFDKASRNGDTDASNR